MKKILITGFEAFGGEKINPSEEIVKRVKAQEGCELKRVILPVSFERIGEALINALSDFKPDCVISLGQAGGRKCVTPEMLAVNLASTRSRDGTRLNKDDHGCCADDEPVIKGAPDAYFSSIPARKLVSTIQSAGVQSEVSFSAGTYLCNYVMYYFQHTGRQNDFKACFIHLPYLREQGEPSMPLEDQLKGIQAVIDMLTE